ncbi:[Wnt protein] O-palmitoleoyl-L-serine hydrolase [Salvia divinorum]|uniref:Pectin acetylesterase n=1 Tax=Salvia divinorum TaxID=28513 RepID=A0ABD1FY36_SALDI
MAKGMHNVNQALLFGCSAGGLASILHLLKYLVDTLRSFFAGIVSLQGVEGNLPCTCTDHLDPTSCFFPQNLIADIKTPLFILNAAYDSWQVQESLAPSTADPLGNWHECKMNNERCSASQIQFLQDFRYHMLSAIQSFSYSKRQQDTWFADDSLIINNRPVALAVGDYLVFK